MSTTVTIDLRHVARGLGIPLRQVQAVVELLDDGNTVPFITRYRKDQTGGLDEEQIRRIQDRLTKARLLAERKQAILRSIESQGKLTERLAKRILAANTMKRLEDLYLPYKPKKHTLATLARSRGLEPLAREILQAAPTCADLNARAQDFVDPDRQVATLADALLGAGHILAEQFSENAELRQKLREVLHRTGRIISTRAVPETPAAPTPGQAATAGRSQADAPAETETAAGEKPQAETPPASRSPAPQQSSAPEQSSGSPDSRAPQESAPSPPAAPDASMVAGDGTQALQTDATQPAQRATAPTQSQAIQPTQTAGAESTEDGQAQAPGAPGTKSAGSATDTTIREASSSGAETSTSALPTASGVQVGDSASAQAPSADTPSQAETSGGRESAGGQSAERPAGKPAQPAEESPVPAESAGPAPPAPAVASSAAAPKRLSKRELKRQKAEERKIKAFSDYFDFADEVRKIPPHRVLALNRGERAKILRVKIEADMQAMYEVLEEILIPTDHPHADFLRGCARDGLTRLILPSLERELRRELTERAEAHAVGVFARNLRNLLLQPPVRGRRVLAVDPGLRSGCKLAALDQFGNVLGHDVIHLIGRAERRRQARNKALELIRRFDLTAVAIGNGTGCRQAEEFFGRLIEEEEDLKQRGVAYVIVNEAGASVYSTSRIGREEFPHYDAALRGAISIGRRLLDPLSELVKIDPPNLGVGLYQHDMKARHLRASLEEVVESCVNYVGVDVNTASPALLRHVSGLNQLTARRVFEHRRRHGPFRTREQLREVPGVGEATFVQAAGFLKITSGSNPLDATWIHPESYAVATQVLEKLGYRPADLARRETAAAIAQRVTEVDATALAAELNVGIHTLRDILAQLARPGRDPREDLPQPVFKHGILKLEDLQPGMELTGTVLNVVDFGAFVDIGMHDCGLVHVSQLADRYVRDPHEVVAVGDVVRVWVMEVDRQRRRVSLTMIPPGTERKGRRRREPQRTASGSGAEPATAEKPPGERARRAASRPAQDRTAAQHEERKQPQKKGQAEAKRPRRRGGRKRAQRPLRPITEAMLQGKEPLRTFGDLLQLYQHKQRLRAQSQAQEQSGQEPSQEPSSQQPAEKPAAGDQASSGQTDQAPTDRTEDRPLLGEQSSPEPGAQSQVTVEQKSGEQESTPEQPTPPAGQSPTEPRKTVEPPAAESSETPASHSPAGPHSVDQRQSTDPPKHA